MQCVVAVMPGLGRSKNGAAALASVAGIHVFQSELS